MQFSAYALLLYPTCDTELDLAPILQAQALTGEMLANGMYAVGEEFLRQICFLGCSPDIELEPHDNKPFCYVGIPSGSESREFRPIRKPPLRLRQWVIVGNVHEAEAVPDAELLNALEAASGCRWKFAYLKP